MELYNFYTLAHTFADLFTNDLKGIVLSGAIAGVALWVLLFLLQGVGIYVIAKKQNMHAKVLAFVPFANIFYLGKIVGDCQFFGQRMKRAGLYTMISQILTTILTAAYIFAEIYLIWNFTPHVSESGVMYWVGLTGFDGAVNAFYEIGAYLMSLFSLVTQILLIILMVGFFKKYSPANYRFLGILLFFVPMARFICIFALRNREPFDYEAYMRRQREAYMHRQQQYYNTYGNPYGQQPPYGGSPYGMGGYQGGQGAPAQKPEDPFEEFSSGGSSAQSGDTGDGFFD